MTKQGKFAENAGGVEAGAERGRPKSGRVWKNVQMKRTSLKASNPAHSSWEEKMKLKSEMQSLREAETAMKAKIAEEKAEIIRKRLQKKQWKEENEKKSMIYQVITNTDKIKKMSRKQLKLVRKMDTNPSAAKHAPKNSRGN